MRNWDKWRSSWWRGMNKPDRRGDTCDNNKWAITVGDAGLEKITISHTDQVEFPVCLLLFPAECQAAHCCLSLSFQKAPFKSCDRQWGRTQCTWACFLWFWGWWLSYMIGTLVFRNDLIEKAAFFANMVVDIRKLVVVTTASLDVILFVRVLLFSLSFYQIFLFLIPELGTWSFAVNQQLTIQGIWRICVYIRKRFYAFTHQEIFIQVVLLFLQNSWFVFIFLIEFDLHLLEITLGDGRMQGWFAICLKISQLKSQDLHDLIISMQDIIVLNVGHLRWC